MSRQKYFIETFHAMEIVLIKALREEDFGHQLFSSDLDKFKLETQIKSLKNVVLENKLE